MFPRIFHITLTSGIQNKLVEKVCSIKPFMNTARIQLSLPIPRTDCFAVIFESLAVEDGNVHHVLNLGVNLEVSQVRGGGRVSG